VRLEKFGVKKSFGLEDRILIHRSSEFRTVICLLARIYLLGSEARILMDSDFSEKARARSLKQRARRLGEAWILPLYTTSKQLRFNLRRIEALPLSTHCQLVLNGAVCIFALYFAVYSDNNYHLCDL